MHAIRQHEFGPADVLRYEEVEGPRAGPGQVRIAVRAAGVHLVDTKVRAGEGGGPFPRPDLPMTPGREVTGTVDALGPGVEGDWKGRAVVAHLGQAGGGYAELAVAPAASLHPVPAGLAPEAAVAMIGTGRTTLGILEVAGLTADDVVAVTAAAGGVGNLLVQAARNAGATVVGLAGGRDKVDRARAAGASVAVDYRAPGWVDEVRSALGDRPVTVALDGVAGEAGRAVVDLIRPGGRLVMFGWSAGKRLDLGVGDIYARGLTVSAAVGPRILQRPGGLRELEEAALAAAAAGELAPLVNPPFPLAEAARSHRALEGRSTVGKVVLVP